jgi:hypothetical protein
LKEDSNINHSELLNDPELDEYQRNIFKSLIVPNKMSFLKMSLNEEYFKDEFPVDFMHNHKHISPSLKKIKDFFSEEYPFYFMKGGKKLTKALVIGKGTFENILSYPKWFYHTFPDIANWIFLEGGASKLSSHFGDDSTKLTDEYGEIRLEILEEIVESFKVAKKGLECSIIKF